MKDRNIWSIGLLVTVTLLILAACSDIGTVAPDKNELSLVEEGGEATSVEASPLITTLTLENGATLDFVDLGEGHVGIGERTPSNAPQLASIMMFEEGATPLEIFLTLAPKGVRVPEALKANHAYRVAQEGRADVLPREVSLPLNSLSLNTINCDPYDWAEGWKFHFKGKPGHYRTKFFTNYNLAQWRSFYPGEGANWKTHLGVCSVFANSPLSRNILEFRVQKKVGSSWVQVLFTHVWGGQTYTFSSLDTPSVYYRGRVRALKGGVGPDGQFFPYRTFGIGAAWTKHPVFQLGLGN